MTEAQLRNAWRRHTADAASADALVEALQGLQDGASASQRERSAALLAEDARAADLGRALLSIQADSRQLESAFLAQRRSRLSIRRLPRVAMAMAAMLALAAVIVLPQWREGSAPAPAVPSASDSLIASSSFEVDASKVDTTGSAADSDTLFRAGFDS